MCTLIGATLILKFLVTNLLRRKNTITDWSSFNMNFDRLVTFIIMIMRIWVKSVLGIGWTLFSRSVKHGTCDWQAPPLWRHRHLSKIFLRKLPTKLNLIRKPKIPTRWRSTHSGTSPVPSSLTPHRPPSLTETPWRLGFSKRTSSGGCSRPIGCRK